MTKTFIQPRVPGMLLPLYLITVVTIAGAFLLWRLPGASALTPISQGYTATEPLASGSIVSLEKNSSDYVKAATTSNVNNLLGIVISDSSSLISLSSGQTGQVQVATSGVAQVLVSDLNGDISTGDQITASPIAGVGMKATGNTKVIGIAQGDLTATNSTKQTYTDANKHKQTVVITQIPVQVSVSYYYKQPEKTVIPSAIQNIANALAGKKVDPLPVLISAGIFVVTVIVVVSIIYSMIHSSIISVGRNPMSQSAIYRDMLQLSALIVGIIGIAMVSIYMILTRF